MKKPTREEYGITVDNFMFKAVEMSNLIHKLEKYCEYMENKNKPKSDVPDYTVVWNSITYLNGMNMISDDCKVELHKAITTLHKDKKCVLADLPDGDCY